MSNIVTRAAGVAGTYQYTLDLTPTAPPTVTVYSDPGRTTVVVAAVSTTATALPNQFLCNVPIALAAGHYYLRYVSTLVGGQTFTDDGNDLVLQAPVGSVGPTIATTGHRVPYVSAAEFLAYPEFLDLNDLITGGGAAAQLDELTNVLLRATEAIDGFCHQPIGAATHTVTRDAVVRRDGCVWVKPPRRPFVPGSVSNVFFTFPGVPQTPYAVNSSGVEYVDGKLSVSLYTQGTGVPMPARIGSRIRLSLSYAAGYPIGALTSATLAGDTQFGISDPTGITAGQVLRIFDAPSSAAAGSEEYVTVSSGYIPGIATIPLTSPLKAHTAGVQVDALPQDVKLACILWAMGLLMRPTSGGGDDPFADAPESPTTNDRSSSRRSGRGLIREARQLLRDGGYVRVMP